MPAGKFQFLTSASAGNCEGTAWLANFEVQLIFTITMIEKSLHFIYLMYVF